MFNHFGAQTLSNSQTGDKHPGVHSTADSWQPDLTHELRAINHTKLFGINVYILMPKMLDVPKTIIKLGIILYKPRPHMCELMAGNLNSVKSCRGSRHNP